MAKICRVEALAKCLSSVDLASLPANAKSWQGQL